MVTTSIYLCSTIKNRADNLQRLCTSLAAMQDYVPCRLVVADFASTDADLRAPLASLPFPSTLVTLKNAPFNRSQGLNYAVKHSGAAPNDILFFVDVDMLVPIMLPEMLRTHVVRGTVWFPICYSLHKGKPAVVRKTSRNGQLANGWWRSTGKGMCGFICADFDSIGRWNERIGVTWGKEDGEIARQVKNKALKSVRGRCEGLFHVWHPGGGYKTRHHRKVQKGVRPTLAQPVVTLWTANG